MGKKTYKQRRHKRHTKKHRRQKGKGAAKIQYNMNQMYDLRKFGLNDAQINLFQTLGLPYSTIIIEIEKLKPVNNQQKFIDDLIHNLIDIKRKQGNLRGGSGQCFGSGVGANAYDPNLSIYNTRLLTLFPWKTT